MSPMRDRATCDHDATDYGDEDIANITDAHHQRHNHA